MLVTTWAGVPPDGWRKEVCISATNVQQDKPRIIAINYFIHTVWRGNSNGENELFYKRSIDDGFSWQSDMQISNAGYVDEVWDGYTIAGDEQGNIYIVWSQGIQWQDYTMWMSHSTDNGFSWSAPEAIDVGLQYDNLKEPFPYLTVDESGCLHLAFQYYYYDGQYNYYLCYSQNSGAGWTNYEEIHSGDASNQMYFVLLTHNQIPHIVFSVKTTTRASKIWHAKRISANNWEETEIVYILGPVYQVDFAKGVMTTSM